MSGPLLTYLVWLESLMVVAWLSPARRLTLDLLVAEQTHSRVLSKGNVDIKCPHCLDDHGVGSASGRTVSSV